MNELVELGQYLVDSYRDNGSFSRVDLVSNNVCGSADFMALIAYPLLKDNDKRKRFKDAMLNAAFKETCQRKKLNSKTREQLAEVLGLDTEMIWRDIDRAITGGVQKKIGGGTKKIIDRLHSYHVFRAYDHALEDDAGLTFEEILSRISVVYESKQSKFSDPKTRIENLKRTFRLSRPVMHLTYGMVESFKLKGWTNDNNQLCYGVKPAIYDPSWLPEALKVAKTVLGLQLVEYESIKRKGKKYRNHLFDPQEIIHVHF